LACVEVVFSAEGSARSLADLRSATAVAGSFALDAETALACEAYVWPTGRSYTRQPTVEIHTLGSPPLLERIAVRLLEQGARPAEPGEFTLRAFLGGRLDLTAAEAVLGVIDAPDRRQLDVALAQLAGGLARPLSALRDALLDLLAHLEAGLDFVEDDIEFISPEELTGKLAAANAAVGRLRGQMAQRRAASDLFRVVLIGRPNAGKSRLFNALAADQGDAIVSEMSGTTRDYLSARIDCPGVPCELIDTAGIDGEGTGVLDGAEIDRLARDATARCREQADLELWCHDATGAAGPADALDARRGPPRVLVLTKIDLCKCDERAYDPHLTSAGGDMVATVATSGATGEGLDRLREQIAAVATLGRNDAACAVDATALRCRDSLRRAARSLHRAWELASSKSGEELVAAEVRTALDELGTVVGEVFTDDILDRVFSRFCIGK
jgi:tRNA modification GTPase